MAVERRVSVSTRKCDNGVDPPALGMIVRGVEATVQPAAGRSEEGQATVQIPLFQVSPRVRSRRRFNAARRWWSQALFLTTPR
jgi:hypothetical protein